MRIADGVAVRLGLWGKNDFQVLAEFSGIRSIARHATTIIFERRPTFTAADVFGSARRPN